MSNHYKQNQEIVRKCNEQLDILISKVERVVNMESVQVRDGVIH